MPEARDQVTDVPLEPLILTVRTTSHSGSRLSARYGVSTKALNQAVKRNAERFPADFAFQLGANEIDDLKSQTVTSNLDKNQRVAINQSQIVTGSHGGTRKRPWVFTEHGALMAANLLRTQLAIHMSIFVIRAFVRLREQAAADAAILKRLAEIDRTLLAHDTALRDVYRKLLPLLAPPAEAAKRRIGF
jgi:hypothetical protein